MTRNTTYIALTALAAVAILIASACGGGDSGAEGSAPADGTEAVTTVSVDNAEGVGDVLVDSEGSALYASDQELGGMALCVDSCATIWQPLTVDGDAPTGSDGLNADIGVATRPDGERQVTFDGRLLYTFVEDTGPAIVTGNGFSDEFDGRLFTWHVATPTGISTTGENTDESATGGVYDF
jgi:predicted lipoprotein with Yx(FWY)xxD motif